MFFLAITSNCAVREPSDTWIEDSEPSTTPHSEIITLAGTGKGQFLAQDTLFSLFFLAITSNCAVREPSDTWTEDSEPSTTPHSEMITLAGTGKGPFLAQDEQPMYDVIEVCSIILACNS